MSDSLRLLGGASVACLDGVCGVIGRLLVEPASKSVTHLAIEPTIESRGVVEVGRLVPLALVRSTGEGLQLDCTLAQFDALEHDEDLETVSMAAYRAGGMGVAVVNVDHVPMGTVEINSTTNLHATDGSIGRLQGVVVGSDGQIIEVLLEVGHFSKKREVSVAGAHLSSISADVIQLELSKSQIEGK